MPDTPPRPRQQCKYQVPANSGSLLVCCAPCVLLVFNRGCPFFDVCCRQFADELFQMATWRPRSWYFSFSKNSRHFKFIHVASCSSLLDSLRPVVESDRLGLPISLRIIKFSKFVIQKIKGNSLRRWWHIMHLTTRICGQSRRSYKLGNKLGR